MCKVCKDTESTHVQLALIKVNAMLIFVIISPYSSPFVHVLGIKDCSTLCNTQKEDIHSVHPLMNIYALLNNANILD